jgi:phthiodiolone/phenolphthiodiolone dimycocerosates ketoreductase
MRVGVQEPGLLPVNSWKRTAHLIRRSGVDDFWFPDHLVGVVPRALWDPKVTGLARVAKSPDGFVDPFVLLGHLARQPLVKKLSLGVAVTDFLRRSPAAVAHAFATLHLLTKGKAILGVGAGIRENTLPYGLNGGHPVSRLEEGLAVVRSLWESDGEPVSREGRFFPLRDALFDLPPFRKTRPPIYVGASGPRMLRITGQYGDGWIPDLVDAEAEYGPRFDAVRTAASDAGRDPGKIVGSGWFFVVVAPTEGMVETALDTPLARAYALGVRSELWERHGVEHPLGNGHSGFRELLPHTMTREEVEKLTENVPPGVLRDAILAGTPSQIRDRLAELRDQGLRHPVLVNAGPMFRFRWVPAMSAAFTSLIKGLKKL